MSKSIVLGLSYKKYYYSWITNAKQFISFSKALTKKYYRNQHYLNNKYTTTDIKYVVKENIFC